LPHTPELNDIEVVWHDLKAYQLAHKTFTDAAELGYYYRWNIRAKILPSCVEKPFRTREQLAMFARADTGIEMSLPKTKISDAGAAAARSS
jgi:DNA-binding transcriptional regulator of glucitol operon